MKKVGQTTTVTTVTTTGVKGSLPPAQGKAFNAAAYVRPGVNEAEVAGIKAAFDLFDTDQGGSIDLNCILLIIQNSRPQWSHSASTPRTESSIKWSQISTRMETSKSISKNGFTSWLTELVQAATNNPLAKYSHSMMMKRLDTFQSRISEELLWT